MRILKTFICFFALFSAFSALFLYAQEQEHYGVSFVSAGSIEQPKSKTKTDIPLPASIRIDDEAAKNRKGPLYTRFKICAYGYYLNKFTYDFPKPPNPATPDDTENTKSTLEWEAASKCKYYFGQDSPLTRQRLLNTAAKEFNFQRLTSIAVTEAVPFKEADIIKFDLTNMKAAKVDSFQEDDGLVYKYILTDKKKINRLYNYSYDQIPLKLGEIMKENDLSATPLRITVYEDYTPFSTKALAVFSYSSKQKYTVEISDLNKTGKIYDITPDYAVKYTP